MINKLEKDFLKSNYIIPEEEDWRKDIAYKKFEYQKQKDQLKEAREAEKIKQYQANVRTESINTVIRVITSGLIILCKITLYMLFLPLILIGAFLGGFTGGMIKLK